MSGSYMTILSVYQVEGQVVIWSQLDLVAVKYLWQVPYETSVVCFCFCSFLFVQNLGEGGGQNSFDSYLEKTLYMMQITKKRIGTEVIRF